VCVCVLNSFLVWVRVSGPNSKAVNSFDQTNVSTTNTVIIAVV
jgi:hypothetical protein